MDAEPLSQELRTPSSRDGHAYARERPKCRQRALCKLPPGRALRVTRFDHLPARVDGALPDVDLAYPTTRFVDNRTEGKREGR